jgi:hypothetical protein
MLDAISILLAVAIGFLLVLVFDPVGNMQPRWAATVFAIALGAGVGIGLTSIIFLFLDIVGAASPASIFGIDLALIGVFAWRLSRLPHARDSHTVPAPPSPRFRWTWMLALSFASVLAIVWTRLIQMATALPVGGWDAWALWNLRAKFLAGPSSAWRYAFSPLLGNTHPDYPPLLSAFVARAWKSAANMDAIAPSLTSLLFFAALLALVISAVALLRGTASALLAGLVVLSTTSLLNWAPSQYADIPLAFYYLAALALIFLDAAGRPSAGHRPLLWSGLCATFAAWTKNEGIVFLAILVVVFLLFNVWRNLSEASSVTALMKKARAAWLLAGAIPGVLLTLWFKFFLAPPSDALVKQGASALSKLSDSSRYAEIAAGFFTNVLSLGSGLSHPLILLVILAVLVLWQFDERYRLATWIASAVLVLVFLSYCAVLLITPYGLAWQVQSSFDRLLLQIWPSVLFVFFVQLQSVCDPAPAAEALARKELARAGPSRKKKRL